MHDGAGASNEPQQPSVGMGVVADPKVLVATTVAALLLAGSAYVWRRGSEVINPVHPAGNGSERQGDSSERVGSDKANPRLRRDAAGKAKTSYSNLRASASGVGSGAHAVDGEDDDDADDLHGVTGSGGRQDGSAGSMGKSARAKERRRRGKDPLKELLKPGGGKLAKVLKASDASTSATPPAASHSRNPSEILRRGSTSRQPEGCPFEDSSSTRAGSSSSSTVIPPTSSLSDSLEGSSHLSPSFASSYSHPTHSKSKSRSRSRQRDAADHEPSTSNSSSKNSIRSNSDAASTISSTSSSTTTEAMTSTAPSSLTSPTRDSHPDADTTPKPELGRAPVFSGPTAPTPTSPMSVSRKNQPHQQPEGIDPWDWDGVGGTSASTSLSSQSTLPKPTKSISTPRTEAAPIPYASVVSAKPPTKDLSRRTLGAEANKEDALLSSGGHAVGNEEEEEVQPLVFPSLNNPAPDSSLASSLTVGPASMSSLSRPQSRASSASSSSNPPFPGNPKSKSPGPGRNATLTPFSVVRTGTPPLVSGSSVRRVPTPREVGSGKRSATPGTTSSTSSPLLSNSAPVPPSPSSPSFPHSSPSFSASSSFAVSVQTQVASLRGALEASRLREQKQKDDVEKVTKERDMLQWQNATWRQREGELQAQLQQTMHQLQTYAAYFASVNHGQHPPQMVPPLPTHPAVTPGPESSTAVVGDGNDAQTPGEKAQESDTEILGSNTEKDLETDGGGVEGSTVVTDAKSSVPEAIGASSPAEGDVIAQQDPTTLEGYAEPVAKDDVAGEGAETKAPLAPTGPLHRPLPLMSPLMYGSVPHLGGGMLSPSILHSPMGGAFAHFPLHATQPVGFGPHGHPMPPPSMSFPFHFPPLPPLPGQIHQQHGPYPQSPFGVPSVSGTPTSPGGMAQHPGMMMNPFIVNPAVAPGATYQYHRPGTPGAMMNGLPQQPQHGSGLPPHPHPPNGGYVGVGMGMGVGGVSSALTMGPGAGGSGGAGSVGSTSPDLTGSPSSTTAFLMQERGRRRGSGSSGMRSASGLKARGGSILPFDSGIGRRNGDGKNSSGSASDNDGGDVVVNGEEEGGFNELLADAILKRPGSIRMGSTRKGSFRGGPDADFPSPGLGMSGGSVSVNGVWNEFGHSAHGADSPSSVEAGAEDGEVEEERVTEFTFPTLSDMGSKGRGNRAAVELGYSSSPSPPHLHSPLKGESPSSTVLATLQEEETTPKDVAAMQADIASSKSEPASLGQLSSMPALAASVSEQ